MHSTSPLCFLRVPSLCVGSQGRTSVPLLCFSSNARWKDISFTHSFWIGCIWKCTFLSTLEVAPWKRFAFLFIFCFDLKSGQQNFPFIDIFLVISTSFMAVEDLGVINSLHSSDSCLKKYELKRQLEWDRMDKNKNEKGAHWEWNEKEKRKLKNAFFDLWSSLPINRTVAYKFIIKSTVQ